MESAEKEQSKTTVSSSQASQQLPTNSQSAQSEILPMFHTPLAVSWGPQEWFSADRNLSQTGMPVPVPVILGSSQFFSMVNPIQIKQPYRNLAPLPTSVGMDQLSIPSRQIPGAQSTINFRPSVPAKPASQTSLSVNRRPTQAITPSKLQRVMPMNMASSLPSTNKRPAQLVSPKVQSESFGSVRSKLRESLAASLAMVTEPPIKQQIAEKSTGGDSPNGVTEVTTLVDETTEDNSFSDKSVSINLISDGSAPMFEVQSEAIDASKKNATQSTVLIRSDVQEHQPNVVLSQEERQNNNSFVKDELLQGHGLCWASEFDIDVDCNSLHPAQKRLKMKNEPETANSETIAQKAENLAFRIESELFKLFGGVNKKYKEKGRSLLFNLKDRNNPELRERVLSGDIAPERLCSMTTEELASKELSEWRIAKAEELAQMVVLPDDVDLRRLVKKTHKGEFQVEVEQVESFPVEAELGRSVPSKVPSKPSEVKTRKHSTPKADGLKASGSRSIDRKDDSDNQNVHTDLEILGEKTDLMQELMVDEVKDPDSLPPIVSLDEFMQALDSEPPFEDMSVDSLQEVPSSGIENLDCLEPEKVPASDTIDAASDSLKTKSETSEAGSSVKHSSSQDTTQMDLISSSATVNNPAEVNPEEIDKMCSVNDENLNPDVDDIQSKSCPPEVALASDKIWEGSIQLNISSVASVIGFYRSGEKASMQEWPSFFEIKGRVRLEAFEKFLKELPLSRTRAIMIVQFSWKEGSSESGRLSLIELSDSYAADNRVGFAEPLAGVEMYLCPPHSRMTDLVEKSLPKEQGDTLSIVADGLIGVVVWRRPHVAVSPRASSHHKHGSSSRKHLSTRKQQGDSSHTFSKSSLVQPSGSSIIHAATTLPSAEDESDDVPPGFGPRDDDDLPEFDFAHGNSQSSKPVSSTGRPLAVVPARPVEQIRQLIHKYGQSELVKNSPIDIRPWNDNDEDDIPEWRPQNDHHHQQQALPPSVPTPPQHHPSQLQHAYPQQPLQVNQQMLPLHHPHIPLQQQQQQLLPLQMAALPTMATQQPLLPQFAMMANPLNMMPRWQQPPLMSLGGVPVANMMQFGSQANADGQIPNLGAMQNVMGWRPDVYGSRGA